MSRITNDMRDRIVKSATTESFKKENDILAKEEHSLGMELYEHVYEKEELRRIKKIDKKWFILDKCLRFNCGG